MTWRYPTRGKSAAKYGNQKIVTPDGTFDSKKEWERFCELHILRRAGEIKDLDRQVPFLLVPAQREKIGVYKSGSRKGQPKEGRVIERAVTYVADFVYTVTKTGERIVEDVKGYRDPASAAYKVFTIKRKLMLWIYGIRVREV